MSQSNTLWDKLIALASKEIARTIQSRTAEAKDENGEPIVSKLLEIVEWGRGEVMLRINKASDVVKDGSISEQEKTRRIFQIMLASDYDEYVQRYAKQTGKEW